MRAPFMLTLALLLAPTAATEQIRATINLYEYSAGAGAYKLRINGDLAQP